MINRSQGEALVALLGQLRKDWDLPGIRAAVQKSGDLGNAVDISVAACRLAGNHDAKTPGLLPMPGNHWQGTTVATKPVPKNCDEHGEPLGRCTGCDTVAQDVDHQAWVARVKAELHASRDTGRTERAARQQQYDRAHAQEEI